MTATDVSATPDPAIRAQDLQARDDDSTDARADNHAADRADNHASGNVGTHVLIGTRARADAGVVRGSDAGVGHRPTPHGDTPYYVSSVHQRMAGGRRRTTVTISARPNAMGWSQQRQRLPQLPPYRPGPGNSAARPSPYPRRQPPEPGVSTAQAARARQTPAVPRLIGTGSGWTGPLPLAARGVAVTVSFLVALIVLLTGTGGSGGSADGSVPSPLAGVDRAHVTIVPELPASRPAASSPAAVVAWAASQLPAGAVIVADAGTVRALRRAGFERPVGYTEAPRQVTRAAYVVDVPAEAKAAEADIRRRYLARSLPLAVFPADDGGSMTVRQVVTGRLGKTRAALRDNAELRKAAGRELVINPALRLNHAARAAMSRGEVDLRIETALGNLAMTTVGVVRVGGPERDAAEQRAGIPVRSVIVGTADRAATEATLRSLPPDYRPTRIETRSATSVRVVWPPTLPTASAVGNSRNDVTQH